MQSEVIGNFKIIEKLGEGGMGEVYKAMDTMLERDVAIKSLRPELTSREDIVARFKTEAIALARLNHPNIATLYSFFRHDDQFFMVMEFVHGDPMDRYIKQRSKVSIHDSIAIVRQALNGLEHAHAAGIIHKDIKPANMMLTTSNVIKLMDFGIARILEKARLTQTGFLIGTLKYMSPEQVRGIDVNAQTDIYALGVVLYELLTGHVPFECDSDYDLIKSKIEKKTPPPRTFNPKVPSILESVILKALEKKPEKRYASATEFSQALQNAAMAIPALESKGENASVTIPMVANQIAEIIETKTLTRRENIPTAKFGSRPRRNMYALLLVTAIVGVVALGFYQWDLLSSGVKTAIQGEADLRIPVDTNRDAGVEKKLLSDSPISEQSLTTQEQPATPVENNSPKMNPMSGSEPESTNTPESQTAMKTSKMPGHLTPPKPETNNARPAYPGKPPRRERPKTVTPLEGWAIEK